MCCYIVVYCVGNVKRIMMNHVYIAKILLHSYRWDTYMNENKSKYQHFVSSCYLDGWVMNDTPAYYFKDKTLDVGDVRNPNSILKQAHTYTVGFEESIIMSHCPLIRDDFIRMIKNELKEREVYVKFNNRKINFKDSKNFSKLFTNLDQWDFYYKTSNKIASKRSITNSIKGLKSYVIENAFSDLLEKNWKQHYNNFLINIKIEKEKECDEIHIKYNFLEEILRFAILSMIRNPNFDFFGLFKISIFNHNTFGNTKRKRCVHLCKLYECLLGKEEDQERNKSIYQVIDKELRSGYYKVEVYSANDSSFITSDNCAFYNKNNVTRQNLNMLIFPLSAYFLLTIKRTREKSDINNISCKGLSNNEVKIFNRLIYNNAYNAIVSKEMYLLANVW